MHNKCPQERVHGLEWRGINPKSCLSLIHKSLGYEPLASAQYARCYSTLGAFAAASAAGSHAESGHTNRSFPVPTLQILRLINGRVSLDVRLDRSPHTVGLQYSIQAASDVPQH